ncbi:heparinase II/III family protein [Microbacterium sp. P05]|uniref:heparinase II/III domain-containing protein n=1 Tax=Microbacterium sp. P05 TaxID=3366948 RepID=UPI0037470091
MSDSLAPSYRGPLAELFETQLGATPETWVGALAAVLVPADDAFVFAPATDRSVWGEDGSADPVTRRAMIAAADAETDAPWPLPLASTAARVHQDGNRDAWEQTAFARQFRLSRAAVAAASTLDRRHLAAAVDGAWLLSEQSSWCWPAHDDARAERGSILPTVTSPFLDLGAGEAVGQLAHLDHLLGPLLDEHYPGVRERLRHEARVRVLDPFQQRRDWHWIGLDGDVHNWNPWIHGNVLAAALRFLDQPGQADERARVVALAVEGLDRYVSSLPSDGAIDEGYAYWWNGACRALEALEVLRVATGGALDASSVPALRETVAFPHRSHLGGRWYLNLADGQARPPVAQPWHALHRAARAVDDLDARAHAAAHRVPGGPAASELEGLGRLLRGMTDAAWLDAVPGASPLPQDVWWPSTEVLLARQSGGSPDGLTLAIKGGHNGEHHNHNDVGSFVVASNGVPVIVDAGRPTYTRQTFSPERYEIWTMQSGWHNVPVLDGIEQNPGADFAAADTQARVSPAASSLELELVGAYPPTGVTSWRRTARLDRTRAQVVVEDSWTGGTTTAVRMLLAGRVRQDGDSVVVTPLEDAPPVRVRWPAGLVARLERRDLDDPMLSEVWGADFTRLELQTEGRGEVRITVDLDHVSEGDR